MLEESPMLDGDMGNEAPKVFSKENETEDRMGTIGHSAEFMVREGQTS